MTRLDNPPADLGTRRLRDLFGRYATGVVAVTGFADGKPVGIAVNSFTSVSLDPPLVAFCVAHTSTTWPLLRTAPRLGLNILGEDQRHVCARLAARSGDKFADIGFSRSAGGALIVDGTPAWLEVSVVAEHAAGDHDIVVGRVEHLDHAHESGPLVFYRGAYGRFHPAV
ncbi:flavin reductase family protein [Saccharothrix syringae]|uniref:Flavin reductase n=1 Tax=Saccharothrix syringae TaxID=103733 RepID=A0A5Q0GYS9_SACSY|nr:flavin reductase family protein [Saccharothrix syringae]QFZ19207.1 flavin reductase [Saccharothrix syringae]